MDEAKAAKYVSELSCLKEFPRTEESRDKIGENIARLCKDESQARVLTDEMTSGRFDEWPGPATLRRIYYELFPSKGDFEQGSKTWRGESPKCDKCLDFGFFPIVGPDRAARCECAAGKLLADADMEHMNSERDLMRRSIAERQAKHREHRRKQVTKELKPFGVLQDELKRLQ